MWVLTSQAEAQQQAVQYYVLADRAYNVGRKNNDILISNDKSISRQHATLSVRVDEGGESTLWVTGAIDGCSATLSLNPSADGKSTYGTTINNVRVQWGVATPVPEGALLRFGFKCTFVAHRLPWSLCLTPHDPAALATCTRIGRHAVMDILTVNEALTCCMRLRRAALLKRRHRGLHPPRCHLSTHTRRCSHAVVHRCPWTCMENCHAHTTMVPVNVHMRVISSPSLTTIPMRRLQVASSRSTSPMQRAPARSRITRAGSPAQHTRRPRPQHAVCWHDLCT